MRESLALAGVARADWSVTLAGSSENEDGPSGGLAELQLEFWTEARKALGATGVFPSLRNPPDQNWFSIGLGRAYVHMDLIVSFREKRVGGKVLIEAERVDKALPQLTAERAEIEKALGFAMDRDPYPEKEQRTIVVWRGVDVTRKENWPAAIDVLTSIAVKLYGAFAPRVVLLDL